MKYQVKVSVIFHFFVKVSVKFQYVLYYNLFKFVYFSKIREISLKFQQLSEISLKFQYFKISVKFAEKVTEISQQC